MKMTKETMIEAAKMVDKMFDEEIVIMSSKDFKNLCKAVHRFAENEHIGHQMNVLLLKIKKRVEDSGDDFIFHNLTLSEVLGLMLGNLKIVSEKQGSKQIKANHKVSITQERIEVKCQFIILL